MPKPTFETSASAPGQYMSHPCSASFAGHHKSPPPKLWPVLCPWPEPAFTCSRTLSQGGEVPVYPHMYLRTHYFVTPGHHDITLLTRSHVSTHLIAPPPPTQHITTPGSLPCQRRELQIPLQQTSGPPEWKSGQTDQSATPHGGSHQTSCSETCTTHITAVTTSWLTLKVQHVQEICLLLAECDKAKATLTGISHVCKSAAVVSFAGSPVPHTPIHGAPPPPKVRAPLDTQWCDVAMCCQGGHRKPPTRDGGGETPSFELPLPL